MDFSDPLVLFLAILAALAVLAILTLLLVFLLKPTRSRASLRLALPLRLIAGRNRKNHIFLGLSPYSRQMAANILQEWKHQKKKRDQGRVIMVNLSDAYRGSDENRLRREFTGNKVVVLCGILAGGGVRPLPDAIGLPGLKPWLANKRTSLYLFSADTEENARLLTLATEDKHIRAKVFIYSSDPVGYDGLVASTGPRVRTLDPHKMAFNQLKLNAPQLMPVHFVQKEGGLVTDGLHAMILGFGLAGQEALRYLYEFGVFLNKEGKKLPMSIKVYDPALDSLLGDFLQTAPALKEDPSLEWHPKSAGTLEFWDRYEGDASVNYIVVAVDDGPKNFKLGVALLKSAARTGKDLSRLVILIRNWNGGAKSRDVIDQYNQAYCPEGIEVLRSFGESSEVWTPEVTSGGRLKAAALRFMAPGETWDERRERLSKPGPGMLRNRMELRRLQYMDISRALYEHTLQELAPEIRTSHERLHRQNVLALLDNT